MVKAKSEMPKAKAPITHKLEETKKAESTSYDADGGDS